MLGLQDIKDLAAAARRSGREPVKTQFTPQDRIIVEHFFRSQRGRNLDSNRMRSFLALVDLLGTPLDASSWCRLEDANFVGDLDFLVGGTAINQNVPRDWQLKCLGLKETGSGSDVFIVGLNRIFYASPVLETILLPD